ncbi:HK97 family phage prohead protease [Rickettsiales bacterium]|nr:HK97 family phage prohead protease [Rickettsiales bacterium]
MLDLDFEKAEVDDVVLVFEGYASVFNVLDRDYDIVAEGAFDSFLQDNKGMRLPMFYEHDRESCIGFIKEVKQDKNGLYVMGYVDPSLSSVSKHAYDKIVRTGIGNLSIGYMVNRVHDVKNSSIVADASLIEVSLVSLGSNSLAKIDKYKIINLSDGDTIDNVDFDVNEREDDLEMVCNFVHSISLKLKVFFDLYYA